MATSTKNEPAPVQSGPAPSKRDPEVLPPGADSSAGLIADLKAENAALRDQVSAAGLKPRGAAPAEVSFGMSEGVRQELELLKDQAERDGNALDDKLPNGTYRYQAVDPGTGKVLTPKDLP